jgi:hypothetical protein
MWFIAMRVQFVILSLLTLAVGCRPEGQPKPAPVNSPQTKAVQVAGWLPRAQLFDKLGPEQIIGKLRLRPPANYTFVDWSNHSPKSLIWAGPDKNGETFATLSIMAMPNSAVGQKRDLEAAFGTTLAEIEKRRSTWTCSDPETGRIGNLEFIRARWDGVCKTGRKELIGKHLHGVVYVAWDAEEVIQIMLEDVEPFWEESLPVCEAAALTFRKSPD